MRFNGRVCCVVTVLLLSRQAGADGGTVRLKEVSGSFVITVFTAPEPLRTGWADVSILVQDRERGEPVLDADVSIAVSPSAPAAASGSTLSATHADATNKLLYAATIALPAPGTWVLRVGVRRGTESVQVACDLSVSAATQRLWALWPYLFLPPAAILLFALHQWRSASMARAAPLDASTP